MHEVDPPNFVQMTNNPAAIVVTTSGANVTANSFRGYSSSQPGRGQQNCCSLDNNLKDLLDGTFGREANFVANLYEDACLTTLPHSGKGLEYTISGCCMAGYTTKYKSRACLRLITICNSIMVQFRFSAASVRQGRPASLN